MAAATGLATPIRLELDGLAATGRLARALAAGLHPGDVICLTGPLGAGKTELARAVIGALAAAGHQESLADEVPSPTFTLVQHYPLARISVAHFDLYRIRRAEEVYELGWEEALADGVTLVEWAERLGPLTPIDRLEVALDYGKAPDARVATITGTGAWAARLAGLRFDG